MVLGTIVNALAIIAGSLLGLILRGGIPDRISNTVIKAIGLTVIVIGLSSALKTDQLLVVIFSMAIGSVIGEAIDIERRLEQLGRWLEKRMGSAGDGFTQGFVTTSLLYCVGAMAIVGSLESGLSGNHETLFAKSVLDGVTAIVFASTLGFGVMFSSVSVFIYQGVITLCASLLKPYLLPMVVGQMSAVGGLLIMAIGIKLLGKIEIRIGNMLPAIFLPFIYHLVKSMFGV